MTQLNSTLEGTVDIASIEQAVAILERGASSFEYKNVFDAVRKKFKPSKGTAWRTFFILCIASDNVAVRDEALLWMDRSKHITDRALEETLKKWGDCESTCKIVQMLLFERKCMLLREIREMREDGVDNWATYSGFLIEILENRQTEVSEAGYAILREMNPTSQDLINALKANAVAYSRLNISLLAKFCFPVWSENDVADFLRSLLDDDEVYLQRYALNELNSRNSLGQTDIERAFRSINPVYASISSDVALLYRDKLKNGSLGLSPKVLLAHHYSSGPVEKPLRVVRALYPHLTSQTLGWASEAQDALKQFEFSLLQFLGLMEHPSEEIGCEALYVGNLYFASDIDAQKKLLHAAITSTSIKVGLMGLDLTRGSPVEKDVLEE